MHVCENTYKGKIQAKNYTFSIEDWFESTKFLPEHWQVLALDVE